MSKTMVLLQNVFALSWCRRRASADDIPGSTAEEVSSEVYEKTDSCPQALYDDDCKSTDTSGPEQVVDSSSDDSDSDSMDLAPNSDSSSGESDSDVQPLTAPKFRDFTVQRRRLARRRAATRLKQQAVGVVPFTVQQQQPVDLSGMPGVREPIKAVINALEIWSSSKVDGDVQGPKFDVLQDAMLKLTAQDTVMMKALLDAQLACQ